MRIQPRKNVRSRHKQTAELSMTPLIDVALTLLIMFMVATPLLQNAIKVTLPHGKSQEQTKNRQDDWEVYIDKDNTFYFNGSKIEKNTLIDTITNSIHHDEEKTVSIKADKSVSYGIVLELVDDIKFIGGVKYVALATQKPSQATHSVA